MFGWFQRLLPQRGDFFGMFEAHAATLVAAAEALQQLATNGCSTRESSPTFATGSMRPTMSSAKS